MDTLATSCSQCGYPLGTTDLVLPKRDKSTSKSDGAKNNSKIVLGVVILVSSVVLLILIQSLFERGFIKPFQDAKSWVERIDG
jgi:hypothetical protein